MLLLGELPIVAAVGFVALDRPGILAQEIGHRGSIELFPVQPPFAARRRKPIGHQHEQCLVRSRAFAARPQPNGAERWSSYGDLQFEGAVS
jgi:hypothetical protein